MIKRFDQLAARFPFAGKVVLLASGTLAGQVIMILVLPLLTRLYAPEAFGLLGIYMTAMMLLATPACLRLEIAIPLPVSDSDAVNLLILSIGAATMAAALLAVLVLLLPAQIAGLLGQPRIAPYLWMFPLGVWLAGIYSAVQFWSIRMGRYRDVAQTQLVRAIGGGGVQVGMGVTAGAPLGLLLGHLFYTSLGSVGLALHFWRRDRHLLSTVNRRTLARNLAEQRRFPILSTPESILDACSSNLPLLLIAAIVGAPEAGFLLLAQRIGSIPIGLIGGSISRVYLAEAPAHYRKGEIGCFTRALIRQLLWIGAGPFMLLALIAPFGVPLVFGDEWSRAGIMISWLVPSMMLQFLSSPVSPILSVTQKQSISLALQLFGALITIGTIILVSRVEPRLCFEFFAIASMTYYAVYLGVVLFLSRE